MRHLFGKILFLLLALLLKGGNVFAELNVFATGARSAALGGAAVTATDIYAANNNQAGLGFLHSTAVAVDYQNRFFTPELHVAAASFVTPIRAAGVLGVSICSFGISPYNELRAGVAFGKQLSEHISLGAQVNYNQVSIANYGSTSAVTAEVGLLARPLRNLWVGAHVYNFTYSKFFSEQYHQQLPVIFNLGAGYNVVAAAALFVQSEFRSAQNARIKAGVEYFLVRDFALRIGTTLKPMELFVGFGYGFRSFVFDFAFSHHETLGYSPQFSLTYRLYER